MTKAPKELSLETQVRSLQQRVHVLELDLSELKTTTLNHVRQLVDVVAQQQRAMLIPQQGYLSGQWHRRDGTVYGRVAEKGSPNANDPAGPLPPPGER